MQPSTAAPLSKLKHGLNRCCARIGSFLSSDDAKKLKEETFRRTEELAQDVNRAFTEHPAAANETYWQHWWFTARMGVRLILTGLSLLVHGLLPFFFVRTASLQIASMYGMMRARIGIDPAEPEDNSGCNI